MNDSIDVDRVDGGTDGDDTQGLHMVLGGMLVDHGDPVRLSLPFLEFSPTDLYSLDDLLPLQA